jgi:hypothetical protein
MLPVPDSFFIVDLLSLLGNCFERTWYARISNNPSAIVQGGLETATRLDRENLNRRSASGSTEARRKPIQAHTRLTESSMQKAFGLLPAQIGSDKLRSLL